MLGSGISRSSGIMTGWDITLDLIRKIAALHKQDAGILPAEWYRQFFNKEPDYSDILESLTRTSEERLNLLRPYFEPSNEELEEGVKVPTAAHQQIAWLVKEGYVKVVVTTNFDRLLENALSNIGVEPRVISSADHLDGSLPLVHSPATILKINGDYLDTKFLNIKSELDSYDPRLVDQLKFIFENYGLITCGWSAQWDSALVDSLRSTGKFRFSSYFTYLSEPTQALKQISDARLGKLVKISDADDFFKEIGENIASLKRSEVHPFTEQILKSRVKKYLSKNEYDISLHDLYGQVMEDFCLKLENYPQRLSKPDLDICMEDFRSVVLATVQTAYWAEKRHYSLLLNGLKRVLSARALSFYNTDLRKFPALVLRYVIGIAALARENFRLLALLCNLRVRNSPTVLNPTLPFTQLTNQWNILDKATLNTLMGTRYHMPQSKLVSDYLRPFFNDILADTQEFKFTFELYELITCLNQIERTTDYGFPEGSYLLDNDKHAYHEFVRLVNVGDSSPIFTEQLSSRQADLITMLNDHFNRGTERFY